MNTQTLINIRNNISNHKPDSTLKMLKSYLVKNDNNDMFNFVIMQEAQYKSLKNQQMAGTIDSNQFDIGLNKINANILNLIDELDVIKIEKIEIKAKSTSKPFNKFEKIFLTSFCIFVIIMISGFTKYSFFKLFNYNRTMIKTCYLFGAFILKS